MVYLSYFLKNFMTLNGSQNLSAHRYCNPFLKRTPYFTIHHYVVKSQLCDMQ